MVQNLGFLQPSSLVDLSKRPELFACSALAKKGGASSSYRSHKQSNYMRKTPKLPLSLSLGSQLFMATDNPKPSTERVSEGAITPSSHRRAEA